LPNAKSAWPLALVKQCGGHSLHPPKFFDCTTFLDEPLLAAGLPTSRRQLPEIYQSSHIPQLQALAMSMSQRVYNERRNIIFGTCVDVHKHGTTKELVGAEEIAQGLVSLSNPPWQNKGARTDHNGDPLSYSDALSQDLINWSPAIQENFNHVKKTGHG
jgi:hypothetical protein